MQLFYFTPMVRRADYEVKPCVTSPMQSQALEHKIHKDESIKNAPSCKAFQKNNSKSPLYIFPQ